MNFYMKYLSVLTTRQNPPPRIEDDTVQYRFESVNGNKRLILKFKAMEYATQYYIGHHSLQKAKGKENSTSSWEVHNVGTKGQKIHTK